MSEILKKINWKVTIAGLLGIVSAYLSGTTDLSGAIMSAIALFLPTLKQAKQ